MSAVTFHLFSVNNQNVFYESIRSAPAAAKPHYIGRCQHWIHSPRTSLNALTGSGSEIQRWDYLVVTNAEPDDQLAMPHYLQNRTNILNHWSIVAPVDLSTLSADNSRRASSTPATLPPGWSPSNSSGLAASIPPRDLEASLALASVPLGSSKQTKPTDLKSFISAFGTSHTGPISMFNILAYQPGQRMRYFGYIAAFTGSIGSRYGGDPQFFGKGVIDWSSRETEGREVADPKAGGSAVWEDTALVWYPSIWHFGKMLDDPDYAEADRKFKIDVVHDNPILCCTEVVL
jgi:hypothetical protein